MEDAQSPPGTAALAGAARQHGTVSPEQVEGQRQGDPASGELPPGRSTDHFHLWGGGQSTLIRQTCRPAIPESEKPSLTISQRSLVLL